MKKIVFQFFTFAICYLGLTFIISCIYGAKHFHDGIEIGYPTIYYQLNVDGYRQYGFKRFSNAIINLIVITCILILYRYSNKKK